MNKFDIETFFENDFLNKLIVDVVFLKNIIKEKQSDLTNSQVKILEHECDKIKNNMFFIQKELPHLSEFVVKNEYQKMSEAHFTYLNDFDEKTNKLKKLEKQYKKSPSQELESEIENIKISRDVEKQKFGELIKQRNDFNKLVKNTLKKHGLEFDL